MEKTPGFACQGVSLPHVRHEVWLGFVFINLSGTAEPLSARLAPLAEQLKEYDLASWVVVKTLDYGECPWDWKVFHDNGDCYHHIGIHRKTAEPEFPLRGAWDSPNNGHYTLLHCRTHPDYLMAGDDGQPVMATLFRPMRGLSQQQRECFYLFYVLPNYACLVYADCAFIYRVFPTGPGSIRLTVDFIVPAETAAQPDLPQRLAECEDRFRTVHAEDVRACTSVQRGLQSKLAQAAPYSHRERHNRDVALWIARQLTT
jgi:phenylpropionate dioxygenase-like ring-hydroxylating dioxygenase large terminal subunit